jgi:hypothetical protein
MCHILSKMAFKDIDQQSAIKILSVAEKQAF